jgi:hypothetical protein
MRVSLCGLGAFALFGSLASGAMAEPISPSWRLCADSNIIAIGTLHAPVDELRVRNPRAASYMIATLDVDETLKGVPSSRIAVHFYPDSPPGPSAGTMIAMDGRRVMIFLRTMVVDRAAGTTQTYLANHRRDALRVAIRSDIAEVRTEVARQARVLREWRPHPTWPHRARVKALIEKALHKETEAQAFKDLEALGADAVPAMVDLMDDRRPIPEHRLTLENPPGFGEATSVYAPEVVEDTMAAILGHMTGENFGVMGQSDEERRFTVNGWRVYADVMWKQRVVRRT